jgi:hypothetical protein
VCGGAGRATSEHLPSGVPHGDELSGVCYKVNPKDTNTLAVKTL